MNEIQVISDGQNWQTLGFKKDNLLKYYTITESDNKLLEKADESSVYSRSFIDNQLRKKEGVAS